MDKLKKIAALLLVFVTIFGALITSFNFRAFAENDEGARICRDRNFAESVNVIIRWEKGSGKTVEGRFYLSDDEHVKGVREHFSSVEEDDCIFSLLSESATVSYFEHCFGGYEAFAKVTANTKVLFEDGTDVVSNLPTGKTLKEFLNGRALTIKYHNRCHVNMEVDPASEFSSVVFEADSIIVPCKKTVEGRCFVVGGANKYLALSGEPAKLRLVLCYSPCKTPRRQCGPINWIYVNVTADTKLFLEDGTNVENWLSEGETLEDFLNGRKLQVSFYDSRHDGCANVTHIDAVSAKVLFEPLHIDPCPMPHPPVLLTDEAVMNG